MYDDWRPSGTFAALDLGHLEDVPLFDGGPSLQPRTEAESLAGPAFLMLGRRTAELLLGGGDLSALGPSYRAVLGTFPSALVDAPLDWNALWWMARVWLVRAEGRDPSTLIRAFPDFVAGLR